MTSGTERLVAAERSGLRIAVACRTAVVLAALLWFLSWNVATGRIPNGAGLFALMGLTALGAAHYVMIGGKWDRPWMKYLVYGADIAAIGAVFAFAPLLRTGEAPQILAFRAYGVQYLFAPLALACLSLSPGLVIFAGLAAAATWWAAFLHAAGQIANPVSWADLEPDALPEDYVALVLSPDFTGRGNRIEETAILLAVAAILALAVWRARRVFLKQVAAEEARARAAGVLGRYVPEAVAAKLMADGDALRPQVREGVALVADVEDFTAFAAGKAPEAVIGRLNDFLAAAADAVAAEGGVVLSFTGDGLLAAWGAPLPCEDGPGCALRAAASIQARAREAGFAARVGLAAGPIAAGSVGSAARRAFTVYGETVNRAARLESLGKTLGETLLMDEAVAAGRGMRPLGRHELRGFAEPVGVWAA